MFEDNFEFLEEEVKNSAPSSNQKLFLKNSPKFLSTTKSKKYITLNKVKK